MNNECLIPPLYRTGAGDPLCIISYVYAGYYIATALRLPLGVAIGAQKHTHQRVITREEIVQLYNQEILHRGSPARRCAAGRAKIINL